MFDVKSTETNEITKFRKGSTPFISASNSNNGIQGFVTPNANSKLYLKNSITVSSLDGTTFYQDRDFIGRGHGSVQVLYSDKINKFNALFVSTIIKKSCKTLNLSYTNQLFLNKLKSLEIMLPANNGAPDWKFMEDFVKFKYKYFINRLN